MNGHYIDVNGLHLYYERHGPQDARTPPLVLLHGGFGATPMFTDLLPGLTRDRQVLALDLQAHGRTADIDRPMRFESLADDISAFLHHLGLPQAVSD
ncbi:alpha/beta fold hydrolase [Deinococcus cavernae]|uniref:Alpha/beta fold hydrolase n=1 Tax=Deinococcus cavernae TaxID=2320857 RepID=A0A418V8T0_9DEIO|nr:alpha/beta fold hydrolase [Deinococcus cavernae]RJF72515.1 alpha/beta fold hydrolase [Deinococcus cavernae]